MLRYKTETRPGLVALYDIRPGNERVHSYNPGARKGRTFTDTYYAPAPYDGHGTLMAAV